MSRSIFLTSLLSLVVLLLLSSCGSYRQNIMFTVPEGKALQQKIDAAEKNYVIQADDYIKLSVFTNNGERLIDPDYRLLRDLPSSTVGANLRPVVNYLITTSGTVKLPMVGEINLIGLTLREAEQILQKEYSKYYQEPFVYLEFQNKRVIVLGAMGGQVIPLLNQNIRLVEVLALAQGVDNNSRAHNIRVLRGDQVFVADFSTFDSYTRHNMIIEPGDVVYIEPIRRPVVESVRDYGPVIAVATSLTTLAIVLLGR